MLAVLLHNVEKEAGQEATQNIHKQRSSRESLAEAPRHQARQTISPECAKQSRYTDEN